MSRLTDIVSEVIAASQDSEGSLNDRHRAISLGVPLVKEDAEAVDQCIAEALGKRIKDAMTRAPSVAASAPDRQVNLFDLRPAHALDTEGRVIKTTRALSRLEFERIRQIRRDQIANDAAYLKRLDEAAVALGPIWDANPALNYGEAEDLFRLARGAA